MFDPVFGSLLEATQFPGNRRLVKYLLGEGGSLVERGGACEEIRFDA